MRTYELKILIRELLSDWLTGIFVGVWDTRCSSPASVAECASRRAVKGKYINAEKAMSQIN